MKEISREWLKYIDISLIDIYPIQFANCDRLQKNDAIYIFDEVGSGKTISSGLMALDYLYNNSGNVLVITTNALAKKGINSEYGQFLTDWYKKLPFRQLKLTERIKVVNNHYSNLCVNEEYGLVIVDEAQVFLNNESLRYINLCKYINAEKIVFLTATPIKLSKFDLYEYVRIARRVTNKELSDGWIDEINTSNKNAEDIICSKFNVGFPVTRYFKDTIMSLNVEGYQKRQARRLTPQLWQYGGKETKNDVLVRMIDEKYKADANNRFVVFTRFVDIEARKIGDLLKYAGFEPYEKAGNSIGSKTYKVITGLNAYELSDYSGTSDLPVVLILTYQIAEQGVNLPGYNHVVNYHVSAFPSALEQRFGRIDRMGKYGSQFAEINMCFLISYDYFDTNTWNFYYAISTYLHNLISYLPSKNTILSEEIIQKYGEAKDYVKPYIEKIIALTKQTEQIDSIIKYFERLNDERIEDKTTIECGCDPELFAFIDDNGIEFNIKIEKELAISNFRNEVEVVIKEFSRGLNGNEDFSLERCNALVKTVSDKIFYLEDSYNTKIRTIDAISECGKIISEKSDFCEYSYEFRKQVKLPILVHNYLNRINNFFEDKFIENDFNMLFPYDGYKSIFKQLLEKDEIGDEDKQLIISNCNIVINILPLFKMINTYEETLKNMVYTGAGEIRMRFDFNPLESAFYKVCREIRNDSTHFGISNKLFKEYFAIPDEHYCGVYRQYYDINKYYKIVYDKNAGTVQASNWYKLAYHYTRREAACFMNCITLCMDKKDNFYKQKEEIIQFLATYYEEYCKAYNLWNDECCAYNSAYSEVMDGENSDFDPNNPLHQIGFYGMSGQPTIVCEYEKAESQLEFIIKKRSIEEGNHQSMFYYFIFTDEGNYRKNSLKIYIEKSWKVYPQDIWTQGIIYEIFGRRYPNCTLDKIAKLPNKFAEVSIY